MPIASQTRRSFQKGLMVAPDSAQAIGAQGAHAAPCIKADGRIHASGRLRPIGLRQRLESTWTAAACPDSRSEVTPGGHLFQAQCGPPGIASGDP